jgi:hypothetical protein
MHGKAADRLCKKLKSQSGESISETLVAVLIAALALTMLAMAISSSLGIVTQAREKLDNYYQKADSLVKREASAALPSGTTVTLTITNTGGVPLRNKPVNSIGSDGTSDKIVCYINDEYENLTVLAYDYSEAAP